MTTQQIQCIITLAEEGSFSKAAKKLFVTQPSISQLIKIWKPSLVRRCSTGLLLQVS